jgi:hypothetical protein
MKSTASAAEGAILYMNLDIILRTKHSVEARYFFESSGLGLQPRQLWLIPLLFGKMTSWG